MVDYSKWDRFDAGSSDEEADLGKPTVTNLSKPSTITIGPDGYSVAEAEAKSKGTSNSKIINTAKKDRSRNGSVVNREGCSFVWSQYRYATTIHLPVPKDLRERDLEVAVKDEQLSVTIASSGDVLLAGALQYEVEATGEAGNPWDKVCDWEVVREPAGSPSDTLRIALQKRSPIPGATLWWGRVFRDDPPIDVTQIRDRRQSDLQANKNFLEADRLFKNKIKNVQRVTVEDSEEQEESP